MVMVNFKLKNSTVMLQFWKIINIMFLGGKIKQYSNIYCGISIQKMLKK